MNINLFTSPFPYIIVDNFFTEQEYQKVWNEIMYLAPKMRTPDETAAAKVKKGVFLKQGIGIFLEDIFRDPKDSDTFNISKKVFSDEVINEICSCHVLYAPFRSITTTATLVQMYKNGDYYLPHRDSSLYTIVTLLHKEPKQYNGGDFKFEGSHLPIPLTSNQTLIFPSIFEHEVTEVKLLSSHFEDARFTVTQLAYIAPK